MLLIPEKPIRGGLCHSIYWYAKANNKYMKDYDKKKELSYLQYWDVNNLFFSDIPLAFLESIRVVLLKYLMYFLAGISTKKF